MTLVNSFCGQKSYIISSNLAHQLSVLGYKVLLIDCDVEARCTKLLGYSNLLQFPNISRLKISQQEYKVMGKIAKIYPKHSVINTGYGFDLLRNSDREDIYSRRVLDEIIEGNTVEKIRGWIEYDKYALRDLIAGIATLYDFVIFDCGAYISSLVASAMNISDYIIPLIDVEESEPIEGSGVIRKIKEVVDVYNVDVCIRELLITNEDVTEEIASYWHGERKDFDFIEAIIQITKNDMVLGKNLNYVSLAKEISSLEKQTYFFTGRRIEVG